MAFLQRLESLSDTPECVLTFQLIFGVSRFVNIRTRTAQQKVIIFYIVWDKNVLLWRTRRLRVLKNVCISYEIKQFLPLRKTVSLEYYLLMRKYHFRFISVPGKQSRSGLPDTIAEFLQVGRTRISGRIKRGGCTGTEEYEYTHAI